MPSAGLADLRRAGVLKVSGQDCDVDLEVVGELADHLSAEGFFSREDFGDRRAGDAGDAAELNLRDPLRVEQMLEHVGVRRGRNGVMSILVRGDQIAERFDVGRFTGVWSGFGQKTVEDLLSGGQMAVGFDGGEGKLHDEFEIAISAFAFQSEAEMRCH